MCFVVGKGSGFTLPYYPYATEVEYLTEHAVPYSLLTIY